MIDNINNPSLLIYFQCHCYPLDTGRKLNAHKTFRRCPGRLLNVLCTFILRPVPRGYWFVCNIASSMKLSDPGYFFKSQGKLFLSFLYILFSLILRPEKSILRHEKVSLVALFTTTIIFHIPFLSLFLVKKTS